MKSSDWSLYCTQFPLFQPFRSKHTLIFPRLFPLSFVLGTSGLSSDCGLVFLPNDEALKTKHRFEKNINKIILSRRFQNLDLELEHNTGKGMSPFPSNSWTLIASRTWVDNLPVQSFLADVLTFPAAETTPSQSPSYWSKKIVAGIRVDGSQSVKVITIKLFNMNQGFIKYLPLFAPRIPSSPHLQNWNNY